MVAEETETRFPILISPLWRPLLLPFGATAASSYAEIEDDYLRVRFGWLFDHRFPLLHVEGASPSHWPLWAGVGWRTNFAGTVGLVGTYVNVVEVRFSEPQRVRLLLPTMCQRLFVSLEEPRPFIWALREATEAAKAPLEPAEAGASGRATRQRKRKKAN